MVSALSGYLLLNDDALMVLSVTEARLRIPAAFVSRVSNKLVLKSAGAAPLSEQMLHRQLLLLGKIVRAPDSSLLRRCVFIDR